MQGWSTSFKQTTSFRVSLCLNAVFFSTFFIARSLRGFSRAHALYTIPATPRPIYIIKPKLPIWGICSDQWFDSFYCRWISPSLGIFDHYAFSSPRFYELNIYYWYFYIALIVSSCTFCLLYDELYSLMNYQFGGADNINIFQYYLWHNSWSLLRFIGVSSIPLPSRG